MISQDTSPNEKKWYDVILEEYQKQQDDLKLKDREVHREDAPQVQNVK